MLRLASDENFNGIIVRQLLRKYPNLDIVRVQDTNAYALPDDEVLKWAAMEGRILLSHDISTMPGFAYERIKKGEIMPGLFAIPEDASITLVVADLFLVIEGSVQGEWKDRVEFLPF